MVAVRDVRGILSERNVMPMELRGPAQSDSPIACNFGVFVPEKHERWQELGRNWRSRVQEIRELPDGYALRIPSDAESILAAAEWMTLDRLCCLFMTFTLQIEGEEKGVWLHLTGREGVKQFIRGAIERE